MAAGAHGLDKHLFGPDSQAGVFVGCEVRRIGDSPRACPGSHAGGRGEPGSRGKVGWRELGIMGMAGEHAVHVRHRAFGSHFERRVAVVAAAKVDEIAAAADLGDGRLRRRFGPEQPASERKCYCCQDYKVSF